MADIDITELEEGDELINADSGEERVVVGFIMNFSGEKEIAKLGHESDGNLFQASVGPSELRPGEEPEWERV